MSEAGYLIWLLPPSLVVRCELFVLITTTVFSSHFVTSLFHPPYGCSHCEFLALFLSSRFLVRCFFASYFVVVFCSYSLALSPIERWSIFFFQCCYFFAQVCFFLSLSIFSHH